MRRRSEVLAAARPDREAPRLMAVPKEREWLIDVPNDPVTEQIVLASMLVDPEVCDRMRPMVPADAFYAAPNRRVRAALELARLRGLSADPATLARLDPEVDASYVERILQARPEVAEDLDFHVENLRYDAHRAKVAQGPVQSFLEALQDPTAPREKLKVHAAQIADAFAGSVGRARYNRDTSHVVDDALAHARARRSNPGLAYPFGLKGLDYAEDGSCRLRPGAAPGGITLLTAQSGMGKTTLAAHLILGLARQKRKVLVGAWEVRARMTLTTITLFSLGWSRSRWQDGYSPTHEGKVPITDEDLAAFEKRARAIAPWVVFMENPTEMDMESASNLEVVEVLEGHVEASGCEVAVWDLLDRAMNDTRPEDEKRAMNRLLRMGDRQQIHQIVVHQQNMKGDHARADGKPTIAGIKGSTGYSENASLVIAPYMPSRWKAVPENTIEVYGLKQRDGAPFAIEFEWEPESGRLAGGRSFDPKMLGDEGGGPVSKSFAARKGKR